MKKTDKTEYCKIIKGGNIKMSQQLRTLIAL